MRPVPGIHLQTTDPGGASANITELCKTITWSGSWNAAARTLSYAPVTSYVDRSLPRAPTELGGSARFYIDGDLVMDAFALDRTRDSLGSTIDVTAYDRGLYLTRSEAFFRCSGQTPESATAALCGEFGIETGRLAATGVSITRNFFGVSLYKIIMTLYTLAADQTGEKYRIRFNGAKLEVVTVGISPQSLLLRPGSNLLNLVSKESASGMTNSVAIYDEQGKLITTEQDGAAVALYGLMQEAIKAKSYDDPVAHAKQVIKEKGLKTTITVNALGSKDLVTGNTVSLQEPVTGTYGLFWIIADRHHWSKNIYQTRATLSFEALMDEQEAGSLPTG